MKEIIDSNFDKEKKKKIENLIQSILNIKREKEKESDNETLEVKMSRRLEERSDSKLSRSILYHLIQRYEIDNNRLPKKVELMKCVVNFLGNIQKSPNYYNLKNSKNEVSNIKLGNNIGNGLHGKVYSFRLDSSQTKKKIKNIAFKKEKEEGVPYPIDVHITSAILLALYDFQPKYYNKYFMEIGSYKNKSIQRIFKKISFENKIMIENNIKFYILYNFTNISDQIQNSMERTLNNEFIKIDLRRLNSERLYKNIEKYLNIFDEHQDIFVDNKEKIIKELDKLFLLNEIFLIDLIKFRTQRGCFNIDPKDLSIQIDCISSSYKVIKISKKNGMSLRQILMDCKKVYNNLHLGTNPAFSWMLYMLLKHQILNDQQYDEYIKKFNEKSEKFSFISKRIIKGEPLLFVKKPEIKTIKKIKKEETKGIYNDTYTSEKNKITIKNKKEKEEKKHNSEIKEHKKDLKIISDEEKMKDEKHLEGILENENKIDNNKNEQNDDINKNFDLMIKGKDDENKNSALNSINIYNGITNDNNIDKVEKSSNNEEIKYKRENFNKIKEQKNITKNKKFGWFCCGNDAVEVID